MKLLCINDNNFYCPSLKLKNVIKGKWYEILEKRIILEDHILFGYGKGLHYYIEGEYSKVWLFHSRFLEKLNSNIKIL